MNTDTIIKILKQVRTGYPKINKETLDNVESVIKALEDVTPEPHIVKAEEVEKVEEASPVGREVWEHIPKPKNKGGRPRKNR